MSFLEDFELIESEPTLPDTSRLAKGAREIRDSFTQKDRERIQAAKPATAAWAEIHIKQLSFAPTNIELASLVARVERGDASDSNKIGFLRVVEATFPNFRRGWLSDLRKAVVNVLAAPQRAAARGEDRNVVDADDFLLLASYGLRKLKESHGDRSKPQLFRFGSEIAEIQIDPLTGAASIASLNYQVFKARMNVIAVYRKTAGDNGFRGVSIPDDVCSTLYAQPDLPLPVLRGITRTPVFDADGNLIRSPGFHEDSGLFYAPPPGFRVELPHGRVSAEDVAQARADLADLFCDFEMDGFSQSDFLAAVVEGKGGVRWRVRGTRGGGVVPPSFLSCVAWMLEQPCRAMIDGPVPALLLSKPIAGSGGGLVIRIMQTIVQGSTAARPMAQSEEERRKAIFTALKSSASTICWDNLKAGHELDSSALATLLTEPMWVDRELGRSSERELPISASFSFVGNRPLLSSELIRRVHLCELLPQVEDPSMRDPSKFAHPHLFKDVKWHRAKYVRALLVLALNWIQSGKPSPKHSTAPGSYEEWHQVIVGILESAAPHWITWGVNRATLADVAGSDDTEAVVGLLRTWAAHKDLGIGSNANAKTVAGIVEVAELDLPVKRKAQSGEYSYNVRSLGHYITGFIGRIFEIGGKKVRLAKGERGESGGTYRLEEVKPKEDKSASASASADGGWQPSRRGRRQTQ